MVGTFPSLFIPRRVKVRGIFSMSHRVFGRIKPPLLAPAPADGPGPVGSFSRLFPREARAGQKGCDSQRGTVRRKAAAAAKEELGRRA